MAPCVVEVRPGGSAGCRNGAGTPRARAIAGQWDVVCAGGGEGCPAGSGGPSAAGRPRASRRTDSTRSGRVFRAVGAAAGLTQDFVSDALGGHRDGHPGQLSSYGLDVKIRELVGVYDADGGLLGEAAYVWGKLRGTRHCGLCDITHATARRKPAWDALVARLPMRFTLLHLNELTDDIASAVQTNGAPVVLGRHDGGLLLLLSPADIDEAAGDVVAFERVLTLRTAAIGS